MKVETVKLNKDELHDLLTNTIAPLPIAFISTISADGVYNAAAFSLVVPICSKPPVICISFSLRQGEKKDTLRNIEFSHDFVVNTVDENLIEQSS